jgi:glycosyltransferase involved in cell wall biosynthesis
MSSIGTAASPYRNIDLVELNGRGGVYQHAVALADELHRAGTPVVLHTATDAEFEPSEPVEVCRCMDWLRDARAGRRARIGARFLGVTLPHLLRGRGVLHVQGPFRSSLLVVTLAVARMRGRRVVYSPHNTFSRRGSTIDARLIEWCCRLAHTTVVFSHADAAVVTRAGATPVVSPLLQHLPVSDPAAQDAWRARWGPGPIVLFAGQIRRDKQLDLLIRASRLWKRARRLAIVGIDKGDAERCAGLAARLGVDPSWTIEYLDLATFASALAAADVIVCPYLTASQSGVLALARQLGTPTVATDVGGLSELATITVARHAGAAAVAGAVDALLASPPPHARCVPREATVAAHRRAYGMDATRASPALFRVRGPLR